MAKNLLVVLCLVCLLIPAHSQTTTFGDTLFSFNAGVMTPSPDRGLVGIEFFNDNFWVTGFNPPTYDHQLYRYSSDGSTLISSISLGSGYHAYFDLAYDGQYLYVTDRDSVIELDPATGTRTGGGFAADFGYLLIQGLAYDPVGDHFWTIPQRNAQLQIIYQMDRNGNILNSYPNNTTDYTTSLTWDSWSPGGPFLWTFSREEIGWDSRRVMRQFSPATGSFTGVEIEITNRSPIALDNPAGIVMTSELDTSKITIAAIQTGAMQTTDGLDWIVAYDADLRGQGASGPDISVSPASISAQVNFGDSLTVPVVITNNGTTALSWRAFAQSTDTSAGQPGDTLGAVDVIAAIDTNDVSVYGLTFARDHYWVSGKIGFDQKKLFKIDRSGVLVATYPVGSLSAQGWSSIASDGDNIYGNDTYSITVWSIDSTAVVNNIVTGSITADAMTFDPNNRELLISNGNGAIEVIDLQGNQVRFMITPFDIEGLAWDNFSPNGPFLWAWVRSASTTGSNCEAIQLNPTSGVPTGLSFSGVDYGSGLNFPEAAVIQPNYTTNRIEIVGLQKNNSFTAPEGFIARYDLGVTPPPAWIKLGEKVVGSTVATAQDTLFVSLHAIMSDTTTQAIIAIGSNALNQPMLEIPVTLQMQQSILTGIGAERLPLQTFVLEQNYPNPFNPSTTISYSLNSAADISLTLFDVLGREVEQLVRGRKSSGQHSFVLNAEDLKSGVYFYKLDIGGVAQTRKMLLVR
ncbi:MAG: T9SS type A sorting domain-containing protein [Calditrichia bacterium]